MNANAILTRAHISALNGRIRLTDWALINLARELDRLESDYARLVKGVR